VGPTFDDWIGDESGNDLISERLWRIASELDSGSGGSSFDSDAELLGRVAHRIGAAIGDAGLQDNLNTVSCWRVPVSLLQQGVDEYAMEVIQLVGSEFPIEKYNLGERNGIDVAETEFGRALSDCTRPRVGVD
jgi:hypothetical protein